MVIVWEPLKVIHQAIISRSCSLGGNRLVVVRVLDCLTSAPMGQISGIA